MIIRAWTSYALSKRLGTRSDEVHAYLAKVDFAFGSIVQIERTTIDTIP